MSRHRYPTDLSDTAWARIARFLVPTQGGPGRPCPPQRWREYVDAILYVCRCGIPWRALPHDFGVSWSAAHKHFQRWTRAGVGTRILAEPRAEARQCSDRRKRPTAAIIDSSPVKPSPLPGRRGFDGAKKVNGIKRHIAVDTAGLLLACHITPGDVQDRAAFPKLLRKTHRTCRTIRKIWGDRGYTGPTPTRAAQRAGIDLDRLHPPTSGGFHLQPRRWVVERTIGWINRHRRLNRQYEATAAAHEGFVMLGQTTLLLQRLDRGQLFDTLQAGRWGRPLWADSLCTVSDAREPAVRGGGGERPASGRRSERKPTP